MIELILCHILKCFQQRMMTVMCDRTEHWSSDDRHSCDLTALIHHLSDKTSTSTVTSSTQTHAHTSVLGHSIDFHWYQTHDISDNLHNHTNMCNIIRLKEKHNLPTSWAFLFSEDQQNVFSGSDQSWIMLSSSTDITILTWWVIITLSKHTESCMFHTQ